MRVSMEAFAKADVPVRLSDIFGQVALAYRGLMEQREQRRPASIPERGGRVVMHPAFARLEKVRGHAFDTLWQFPASEKSLVALFQRGRELDRECRPPPTTEKYLVARQALNAVLKKKGFDITVY